MCDNDMGHFVCEWIYRTRSLDQLNIRHLSIYTPSGNDFATATPSSRLLPITNTPQHSQLQSWYSDNTWFTSYFDTIIVIITCDYDIDISWMSLLYTTTCSTQCKTLVNIHTERQWLCRTRKRSRSYHVMTIRYLIIAPGAHGGCLCFITKTNFQ